MGSSVMPCVSPTTNKSGYLRKFEDQSIDLAQPLMQTDQQKIQRQSSQMYKTLTLQNSKSRETSNVLPPPPRRAFNENRSNKDLNYYLRSGRSSEHNYSNLNLSMKADKEISM